MSERRYTAVVASSHEHAKACASLLGARVNLSHDTRVELEAPQRCVDVMRALGPDLWRGARMAGLVP